MRPADVLPRLTLQMRSPPAIRILFRSLEKTSPVRLRVSRNQWDTSYRRQPMGKANVAAAFALYGPACGKASVSTSQRSFRTAQDKAARPDKTLFILHGETVLDSRAAGGGQQYGQGKRPHPPSMNVAIPVRNGWEANCGYSLLARDPRDPDRAGKPRRCAGTIGHARALEARSQRKFPAEPMTFAANILLV